MNDSNTVIVNETKEQKQKANNNNNVSMFDITKKKKYLN